MGNQELHRSLLVGVLRVYWIGMLGAHRYLERVWWAFEDIEIEILFHSLHSRLRFWIAIFVPNGAT